MILVDCCMISYSIVISISRLTSITRIIVVSLQASMTYSIVVPLRILACTMIVSLQALKASEVMIVSV